jgi:hypothetical protein
MDEKALQDELGVSPELRRIVGPGPHTRVSLTRKLWEYIENRELRRGSGERMSILPDSALAAVLGTKSRVGVQRMTDLVNKHVVRHKEPRTSSELKGREAGLRTAVKGGTRAASNHWLWVAKPEFYEHADGSSSITVGPEEGWWTCARQTTAGDLALLYRAKIRKDIAYLMLATSNAFSILDDPFAEDRGWEWACDYEVLYEFTDPVPLSVLRANKEFWDWPALKINFQGRAFPIPHRVWDRLIELALPSNPGLAKFVGPAAKFSLPQRILAERELEDSLAKDLRRLQKAGWDLEIWQDPVTARSGRQFVCAAAGGRIDLLCRDRKSKQLVVVELKNVLATEQTYLQTWRYVSWVQRFLGNGQPVSALVVARGCDSRFELMTEASDKKVRYLSLQEAGFQ